MTGLDIVLAAVSVALLLVVIWLVAAKYRRSPLANHAKPARIPFQSIMEHVPLGIAIIQDHQLVFANEMLAQLFGYDLAEFTQMSPEQQVQLIHPADRDRVRDTERKRSRGQPDIPTIVEFRITTRTGDARWLQSTVHSVPRRNSTVVLHTVADITARKMAQAALKQREARYRAVVDEQTDLVCRLKPSGQLTFVNEAYCRLFNMEQGELIGSAFLTCFHEEDRAAVTAILAGFTPARPIQRHEHRIVTAVGGIRWYQWNSRALYDERGEIAEVQCVGRDIDELKKAQKALQEAERRYRATIDSMSDMIHVVDRDLKVILHNRALAQRHVEYKLEHEIIGRHISELYPFLGTEIYEQYEQVFRTGEVLVSEEINTVADQRVVTETRKIPLFSNGQITGVVTVMRDFTEHKETKDVLAIERALLKQIIDKNPYSIQIFSPEGYHLSGNEAFIKLWKQAPGPDYCLYDDPLLLRHGMTGMRERLRRGEVIRAPVMWYNPHDISLENPDVELCLAGVIYPIMHTDGTLAQVVVMHEAVTERARAERALRESEEKFRALAEHASLGIAIVQDNRFIFTNEAYTSILGHRDVDLHNASLDEMIRLAHLEDQPALRELAERWNQGEEDCLTDYEYRVTTASGSMKWLQGYTNCIPYRGHRAILQVVADITARKRAESERNRLIEELSAAVLQVKQLRGLLPICAICKKIRNDEGYWEMLEAYISEHSEAEFTHSICPECAKNHYPGCEDDPSEH